MTIEKLLSGGVTLVTIVGALAFFVSIVVQLTKDFIPKKIPTKLYTLLVSIVVTVSSVLSVFQIKGVELKVYLIVGSIALSFVVAFIATFGWEEFKELKDRFMKQ